MQKPRYTKDDSQRFRLPYVRAAESQHATYLTERFAQYRALQQAQAREVVPIKRKAK